MTCLIITPEIEELAKKLGMEPEEAKGLISIWQEQNNKSIEDYPSAKELSKFRSILRSNPVSKVSLSTEGYRKGDPQRHPDVNYVFTENAEAYIVSTRIPLDKVPDFPNQGITKLNVSDVNGTNQAGIRTDNKGNISPNAYGIVVKKYQQDANGKFVAKEGQFQDTDEDFNLFISLNEDMFRRLSESSNKKIVFPTQMGLGKAALPKRFAEWLQSELSTRFGINSTIEKNQRADYDGYGLKLNSISTTSSVEEVGNMPDEALSSPFETPEPATVEDYVRVNMNYLPEMRRDRVNLIARLFSQEVDTILAEYEEGLKRRLENDENAIAEEKVAARKRNESLYARMSNTRGAEKEALRAELETLDRWDVINKVTPGGIFQRILETVFQGYVNGTEEGRIQAELQAINSKKGAEKYTEEEKLEIAKRKAEYRFQAYQKVIDNFKPLAEEAAAQLLFTEGIRVDPNYMQTKEANLNSDTPEGDSYLDEQASEFSQEEAVKDGWMSEARQVSSYDLLSQVVRKAISRVPRLNSKGKYDKDDLGFLRYLDANYVHATLMDKLRGMLTPDDMIPLLVELSKTKPWVKQIVILLQKDEQMFSKFYQDFRKDFLNYWIQKTKVLSDGKVITQTIPVNKPEGIGYLLDAWRDNYESGYQLDEDSIYNKDRTINVENAEKGLKWTITLRKKFSNKDKGERAELLEQDNIWKTIQKLLNMIGIDSNDIVLRNALTNERESKQGKVTPPITILLTQLDIIFDEIKKKRGLTEGKDLINDFSGVYGTIAGLLSSVTEDAIESSISETIDGKVKTYYGHTNPCYLVKLIEQLKNRNGDEQRFNEFIDKEYGKYEWFYDHEERRWRNWWLEEIIKDPKIREGLAHKVVLSFDGKSYSNWDDIDYTLALLNEYWAELSKSQWAWYHVPILSDSTSAEFIRFKKFVNGTEYGEDGEELTYQESILNRLVDLVNQEYDRIMLVIERDELGVSPIANLDIKRDKEGEVTSIGGAEFKFIPAFNDLRYEDGKTFLQKLGEMSKSASGEDLQKFIKAALYQVIEDDFEATYREWADIGLLEELGDGRYKYLPYHSQTERNSRTAKALNMVKEKLGSQWTREMEDLLSAYFNNEIVDDRVAGRLFFQMKELLANKTLSAKEHDDVLRYLEVDDNAKEALRNYYWNSLYATSQIIELTTTDLAYYANFIEFQKRNKQIHSPALRVNTKATYKGERIGRDWERTIYLKDDKIISSVLSNIETVIMEKHKKGELSDYDAASILSKFGYSNHTIKDKNGQEKKYAKVGDTMVETSYVNVADAQAYRSLDSYRAVKIMSGDWTDEMERAYNNFSNGEWSMADFDIIWQPIKPFLYTQTSVNSKVEGHTDLKVPVQHKNSEFPLLAMYGLIAGPLGKSGKLKAINKFMHDYNIDVVQFESAVKVGKQGLIDLNGLEDEKSVMDKLLNDTGIGKGKENPDVVHTVSYEDWGISTATPEHSIDVIDSIKTQIRKLITADMPNDPNFRIEVNGKKLTKQEWLDLYDSLIVENLLQAFIGTNNIFQSKKEIEKILQEELRGNPRYGMNMIKACTLDENGEFTMPFYDAKIQSVLFSIIKSRITKQKMRGGSLIQVSAHGRTEDLHIVFKDKDGNSLSWEIYKKQHPRASRKEYEDFVKEARNKGDLAIQYFECYMPAYTREFFEPLMDPETHVLDINKKGPDGKPVLPEELRKLIGTRVPTEDKYSMAPLYIKDFLPQQNGSSIMLPAEITTIAGSDFDVDKLYIMLPEFKILDRYKIKDAWDDFYNDPANADIVKEIGRNIGIAFEDYQSKHSDDELDIDDYIRFVQSQGVRKYQFSETAQKRFAEWFKSRRQQYSIGEGNSKIVKVQYDFNKSPQENSLEARNNMLIDLMWGVLTNPDTASKILNPGGFDYQKKAERICTILTNSKEADLAKELGVKSDSIIDKLISMSLDELDKLANRTKRKINPLSPRTQVIFHQQNMTGANMIGIYANHNANHAVIQHTQLALDEENGSFILNGKRLTSLHEIMNDLKEYISKNNSGYLAASVDNAKDPVLAGLNQNSFTADVTMLLSRLGYTPIEIGLLLNQPIIKDMVKAYLRESRSGKSKDAIIQDVIKDYKKKNGDMGPTSYNNIKNNQFFIKDLANNILIAKEMKGIKSANQTSYYSNVTFYRDQLAVGYLFSRMMTSADALSQLVQCLRADTQKGAAGPSVAETITKIQKVRDFAKRVSTDRNFPLKNANVIFADILGSTREINENQLRERLLRSPLPYMQAFYTLGVEQAVEMLKPLFYQLNDSVNEAVDILRGYTKLGRLDTKTLNSFYKDLLAYGMSRIEFFGSEDNILDREKRAAFIKDFPAEFNKIIESNPDIANLDFIKRLKVISSPSTSSVPLLVFKNVGKITPILREKYTRDWATLLYMENPEAQRLALNLVRYDFFRNGLSFGPSSYVHLAPLEVLLSIPEFREALREITLSEDDYSYFIDQFIYNHLDNRKLVPEIPLDSSITFLDENNNPLDEIVITIDEQSNSSDLKAVKSKMMTPEGPIYSLFNYVARRYKGGFIYYRQTDETDNSATYERIEPLGVKNNFIEYEYGKFVEDMKSVIPKKRVKENTPDFIPEYEPSTEDYMGETYGDEAYSEAALLEAYNTIYGESLEMNEGMENDALSIPPNVEYKDADNQKICGSELLKSM